MTTTRIARPGDRVTIGRGKTIYEVEAVTLWPTAPGLRADLMPIHGYTRRTARLDELTVHPATGLMEVPRQRRFPALSAWAAETLDATLANPAAVADFDLALASAITVKPIADAAAALAATSRQAGDQS